MTDLIKYIRNQRTIKFTEWCPTGFKIGLSTQPPLMVPSDDWTKDNRAVCMISNSMSISEAWTRLNHKFDCMCGRRSFVHWYVAEGMEENGILETKEDLIVLGKDYEEVGLDATVD
ncbi:tubulin alpha [Paragonimus westermani]|uniref:Tubulin alpha n=1 Tax=Paragonimus westermani TaxID=34504 RepID=A0A5J4NNV8_9TREM|nr:tubulin alpha [Paragonimus westermani]